LGKISRDFAKERERDAINYAMRKGLLVLQISRAFYQRHFSTMPHTHTYDNGDTKKKNRIKSYFIISVKCEIDQGEKRIVRLEVTEIITFYFVTFAEHYH
jgi:hypothetical protein